jgi:RecB family exonuclease
MGRTYSHSALRSFRNCPQQFAFQYIVKPDVPHVVHADAYMGNAVHRVLRDLYAAGADDVLIPREEALRAYRDEWRKVDRKAVQPSNEFYTIDDYIRIGEKMLGEHYDKYRPFNRDRLLGTELRIIYTLPGTLYKMQAIIDRLAVRQDGTAEIRDYKTGRTPARPDAPDFHSQMGIYQLAVQHAYPQFESIELVQEYLRRDGEVRYTMPPEELDELTEALRTGILAIEEAQRLESFPAVEGNHCQWCRFVAVCPAKRHRRRLEEVEASGQEDLDARGLQELAEAYITANDRVKAAEVEADTLKDRIKTAAREQGLAVLEGVTGKVKVRLGRSEKFVTKTKDAAAFAELQAVAREMGLDDYFQLDGRSLMKEIFAKRRLPEDQMERLRQFVRETEDPRVTVSRYTERQADDD